MKRHLYWRPRQNVRHRRRARPPPGGIGARGRRYRRQRIEEFSVHQGIAKAKRRPVGLRLGAGLRFEAEARLRQVLLNHEIPAGIARWFWVAFGIVDIEPKEDDIRADLAPENRELRLRSQQPH